jgi:2-dehydro-3-deoxyphosphogluconate aldolase/(4S)-4-hydroxy-2-oxoglutarate aldolase
VTEAGQLRLTVALAAMREARVIPVVTVQDAATAAPLAQALVAGGLPVVEITLRTPAGLDAIRAASLVPGSVVGAGTVTNATQAEAAVDAGAVFLVSPGLVEDVVAIAARRRVLVLPGIATPTEMLHAMALGCDTVKVFPASVLGGPALVRALAALGTGVEFVPTGGIDLAAAPAYVAIPEVVAVGGSWMVPKERLEAADWAGVRDLAAACGALRAGLPR